MRKARRSSPLFILLAIVLVAIAVYAVMHGRKNGGPEIKPETTVVKTGGVRAVVSATGQLEPLTSVEVKSNVAGQIIELTVDEGDTVRAGQLIARLDPSDYNKSLERAEADLTSARSKAKQAAEQSRAQPELTGTSIQRYEHSLESARASLKQTKDALVPQKLAEAQANYDQAKASHDQAKATLPVSRRCSRRDSSQRAWSSRRRNSTTSPRPNSRQPNRNCARSNTSASRT